MVVMNMNAQISITESIAYMYPLNSMPLYALVT